jgi:hypothetical protein
MHGINMGANRIFALDFFLKKCLNLNKHQFFWKIANKEIKDFFIKVFLLQYPYPIKALLMVS